MEDKNNIYTLGCGPFGQPVSSLLVCLLKYSSLMPLKKYDNSLISPQDW